MSEENGSGGNHGKLLADVVRWKQKYREQRRQVAELLDAIGAKDHAEALDAVRQMEPILEEVEQLRGLKLDAETKPDEWKAKYEEARGQLLGRDHRDAFDRLAKDYKGEAGEVINPAALDALYKLSGHRAEGDVDEAKLTEAIRAAVTANPFVLQQPSPAEGAPDGASTATPPPSGPGGSRGSRDTSSPRVSYTSEEVAQPGWQERRPDLVEALTKGTAVRTG